MPKRKKSRTRETSKGQRRKVVAGLGDTRTPLQKMLDKQDAWRKGKNVVLTVPNPNTNETNKPFIRVKAKDVWGTPKKFVMKSD